MTDTLVTWANAGFTQAVAAAALIGLCNWLMRRWRSASDTAKTELRQRTLRALSKAVDVAQYLVVYVWVWRGLAPLLEPDTPPTRREVVAIALWTSLGVVSAVLMVMAFFAKRRAKQAPKTQPENCSTEPGGPPMSADSLKSNPTAAMPSTTQQTGSGTAAP